MDERDTAAVPGVSTLADRDEAEIFRSVLNTSNIATIVLGPDFTVQWANDRVEDYFGIPREEMIGEDKAALIDSRINSIFEHPDRFAETVLSNLEDNSYLEAFECHVLPGENREDRWLEHRSKPIESGELAGGRIEHYLDITERKQRESLLATTKERLKLAAGGTDTGIWEWDMETDDVLWTDELERLAGLDPGDFGGTFAAFADRIHPADAGEVEAAIDEAIEQETMYRVEFRLGQENGQYRWVEARGQTDRDGDGQRMVGTVTDITQRKEREQQYERLTERITSGYYAIGNDWTITYWNDVMAERQDVPAADVTGKDFWEQYPEIEGTAMAATLREAMESGDATSCEFYYDELDYWTKLRVFPDENGISVLSTEITERKEREQELERTHEFLEETQKAGGIGGWEVDLRSDELRWTDEVHQIHGVPPEYEPQPDEVFDFYHPEDQQEIEAAYERAITAGEPYDLELRLVRADDRVRWVRTSASPKYDDEGEIVGVRGMLNDITDRKRRLSAVLDNTPVILFRIDDEGVFTESQGEPLAKLGMEPGEAVGESIYDLYAGQPQVIEGIERALDGEEVRVTTEIGGLIFESEYRPITGDDGDVREVVGISFDITERKQQERRLEENDAILSQLTETTEDVFWLFDSEFTELQFANDAYETVWGRSIADLREDPMDFMEGVHPEDREAVAAVIGELQAGHSTQLEYRVNADEEFGRWVSVRGEPIFDDEGEVIRAAGYARDITEQKADRRKLERRSEAMDTTADGIGIYDADQEMVYSNQAQADIYGYDDPDDLLGQTWRQFYDDEQIDWIQTKVLPELMEQGQWLGEVTGQKADGTPAQTELSLSVLADGEIVGVVRDITERKERERQLRSLSEATQQLSLAQTTDAVAEKVVEIASEVLQLPVTGIWKYDEGEERLFPWAASDEALGLAGVDEVAGIGTMDAGSFEMDAFLDGESAIARDYQSLENRAHPEVPIGSLLMLPVGEYALLNVAASEVDAFDSGQQNLLSILASNASTAFQRAEREETLETYKNSLERSNENLQEFAYVASHDLQEPLRSVTSYLDLLETEYGDDLDEDAEFYIERATNNAEQMSSLIDALLEYSRVKTDEGEFEEVSVDTVVEDTLDGIGMLVAESDAEITTEPMPSVVADASQLGQVFQNLVANAIDHGGDPPTIGISAEDNGDLWEFAVTDDGPGIPETQHDRIFEIFQQANTDGKGEAGIGLAICERIVTRHQGDIWVESEDSGSTFKFTIPKQRTG